MSFYDKVAAWQEAMGLPCGDQDFYSERFQERRMRIMAEEFCETLTALTGQRCTIQVGMYSVSKWEKKDPVACLDGLADSVWVACGTAAEAGWDMNGAFAEVDRSNNSKTPGLMVGDKLTKGPNFTPPNLVPFTARKCCDWHDAKDQGLLDKAKFFAICEPGKP